MTNHSATDSRIIVTTDDGMAAAMKAASRIGKKRAAPGPATTSIRADGFQTSIEAGNTWSTTGAATA